VQLFKLLLLLILTTSYANAYAEDQLTLSPALAEPSVILTNAHNVELTLVYDPAEGNSDLWQRLRGEFSMQEIDSPLVTRHEQWYAAHPDYVARMMARANRYLYYITSEVERRGMPGEIALLPMIESAFNPSAYSSGNASGIWQFIPSTGRNFGLRQNWWYDGRRDIIGATTGALDYLDKLHTMFGDWELALAAYNWGEGSVQRAQERNRRRGMPTDYASLTMPNETRNYVPKLLAIKNVIADPARFGLALPTIPNEPYFAAVTSAQHIDVKLVAKLANISREEFVALNPAHNRPVILQDNNEFILLPVDKIDTYRTNLENYDKPLVSWQAYQTKNGESLATLAPRFGLSVEKLKKVNSLSERSSRSSGQTLLVPLNGATEEDDSEFEPFNMHLHPVVKDSRQAYLPTIKHVVHHGETLNGIAGHHRVTAANLKKWNAPLHRIKAGQTLNIVQTKSTYRTSSRRLAQSKRAANRSSRAGKIRLANQDK